MYLKDIIFDPFRFTLIFYKNNFIRTRGSISKFKNNSSFNRRTKSQIFIQRYVDINNSKCSTIRKVHFASCLFTYNCSSQMRENKHKLLYTAYLTSWHNSIFGYKLRTTEAENP